MKILITLSEAMNRCDDWAVFCEEEGWSLYTVTEGGADIEIKLSEKKAYKYGILKSPC